MRNKQVRRAVRNGPLAEADTEDPGGRRVGNVGADPFVRAVVAQRVSEVRRAVDDPEIGGPRDAAWDIPHEADESGERDDQQSGGGNTRAEAACAPRVFE